VVYTYTVYTYLFISFLLSIYIYIYIPADVMRYIENSDFGVVIYCQLRDGVQQSLSEGLGLFEAGLEEGETRLCGCTYMHMYVQCNERQ